MPEPLVSPLSVPPSAPSDGKRAAALTVLRARVRRIEGIGGEGARVMPFGVEAIDAVLPDGGLPLGCLHALAGEESGTGTAFAAALLARLATARAPALWIVRGRDLHAAGLAAYGLTPDRLIAVRAVERRDALWAMEEALRCSALSAVLGEVGALDLTASRRLQLAAESSGVTGFLLSVRGEAGRRGESANAAVTRWRLAAAPSQPGDEPGVGAPRWRVALERCRGGRPGAWLLEWTDAGWASAEAREDRLDKAERTTPPSLERVA